MIIILELINNPTIKPYLTLPCVYPKAYTIYSELDQCNAIGIILKGSVKLTHYTYTGEAFIMSELKKGSVFGDFLIFSDNPIYPGDLETLEETEIIYINKEQLKTLLETHKDFRDSYIKNLSQKAISLNLDNKLLRQTNLREKILFWIDLEKNKQNNNKIFIESKEKLAKILNVQRPSLSRELANMKREKIIDFDRKSIWLIK